LGLSDIQKRLWPFWIFTKTLSKQKQISETGKGHYGYVFVTCWSTADRHLLRSKAMAAAQFQEDVLFKSQNLGKHPLMIIFNTYHESGSFRGKRAFELMTLMTYLFVQEPSLLKFLELQCDIVTQLISLISNASHFVFARSPNKTSTCCIVIEYTSINYSWEGGWLIFASKVISMENVLDHLENCFVSIKSFKTEVTKIK